MQHARTEGRVMWTPDAAAAANTNMHEFMRSLGGDQMSYDALHRYSVARMREFWEKFWIFTGIVGTTDGPGMGEREGKEMWEVCFFPERQLNFAENLLQGDSDRVAVIEADEQGVRSELTLRALRVRVAQAQAGLRKLGVQPHDRIAGMLPNNLDALVMLLASTSLGAIWSSCSPEFGVAGVTDRFGQIAPRVLVIAADYLYNGKRHSIADKACDIARQLDDLECIVTMGDVRLKEAPCEVRALSDLVDPSVQEPQFTQFSFDHPLYIVYTSGTTGLPKCIVHRAGGTLLNLRKEHMLHCDVRSSDRVMYYTNTAWMMYHWLVAALASQAAIVLYDGAAIPKGVRGMDPGALWRIAEALKVTHFGTSPKYLSLMEEQGYDVGKRHDLSFLRMIMSAGAPLTVENFEWVYGSVKSDLCLASISGGTEIMGCFAIGNPMLPVRAGELQVPALGMSVYILDERNAPVVGRKGELVCVEPFPSMPLGFWGENGHQRFLDEYFSVRPGIWTHGDFAEFRESGGLVIFGRVDATLKPGGVRIGTGEIYRVVEKMKEVEDAVAVGYPVPGDMEIWLFVVLRDDIELDNALEGAIRARLRQEASPRHVPRRIFQVDELPYTLNGKKVEKAILNCITGKAMKNRGSLSNPDCLDKLVQAVRARLGPTNTEFEAKI